MEPPENLRAPEEPGVLFQTQAPPVALHPELVQEAPGVAGPMQPQPGPGLYAMPVQEQAPPMPAPVPQPVAAQPVQPAQPQQPERDPALENAMQELLKRMDETSEMMRDMRKSA
jgi:hypothetical protein